MVGMLSTTDVTNHLTYSGSVGTTWDRSAVRRFVGHFSRELTQFRRLWGRVFAVCYPR